MSLCATTSVLSLRWTQALWGPRLLLTFQRKQLNCDMAKRVVSEEDDDDAPEVVGRGAAEASFAAVESERDAAKARVSKKKIRAGRKKQAADPSVPPPSLFAAAAEEEALLKLAREEEEIKGRKLREYETSKNRRHKRFTDLSKELKRSDNFVLKVVSENSTSIVKPTRGATEFSRRLMGDRVRQFARLFSQSSPTSPHRSG